MRAPLARAACAILALNTPAAVAGAQDSTTAVRPWYDRLSIRGHGLEITAAYTFSDRFYRDSASPDNHHSGRFLRLQAQVSF
jgi:hypothetical protein